MNLHPPIRRQPSEEGYILVAVIFMLAILILSLAVAFPLREDIQRDREDETMQRGKQYIRAIQLYYKKFHAYPPNVDALVKTNDIRFLRKKYIDPTTGKEDWKPILFGQNKTPQAMGFFGQPLAGASSRHRPWGGNTGLAGAPGTNPTRWRRTLHPHWQQPTRAPVHRTTGGTDANGNPVPEPERARPALPARERARRSWNTRLRLRLLHQPHRHRPDLRWRRHHRLFTPESEAIDSDLQEKESLQRVGVPLRSAR